VDGSAVLYAAARWLGFLAAFLLVGAAVTRWVVLPRAGADPEEPAGRAAVSTLARTAVWSGLLLLVALLARLYFQTRSLLDPEEPVTAEFVRLVLQSAWGSGWKWQLGAAGLGLLAWLLAGPRSAGWSKVLTLGAALAIVGTAPLTGHAVGLHAAGAIGPWLDGLHFAAGAVWLGTLATTALVALRPTSGLSPGRAIAAFSPVALLGAGVAMAAGVVIGWRYVGGLAPLVETGYGRVLLLKVAALLVVAALGAYNWRVALPRLRASDDPAAVHASARLELAMGAVLLAITAVLVALPAPGE